MQIQEVPLVLKGGEGPTASPFRRYVGVMSVTWRSQGIGEDAQFIVVIL